MHGLKALLSLVHEIFVFIVLNVPMLIISDSPSCVCVWLVCCIRLGPVKHPIYVNLAEQ